MIEPISLADKLYGLHIEELAKNRINQQFSNSHLNNAIAVLTSMARYSEKSLKIYCGNLCTEVSSDEEYLREIQMFLERKGDIKVVLCGDDVERVRETQIWNLFKKYPERVNVYKTEGKVLYNNQPCHFTVSDGRAYRLETDTQTKKAFGNFSNDESALCLEQHFDLVLKSTKTEMFPFE